MKYARNRIAEGLSLIVLLLTLATACASHAETLQSYLKLGSFPLQSPSRIAVDDHGSMYVASLANDAVYVLDSSGLVRDSVGVENPVSLDVDGEGVLYAGSENGYVYSLESGAFVPFVKVGYPASIAFSSGGELYVLDLEGELVRVFSPEGAELFSFGGSGTGDGKFYAPVSLAVSSEGVFVLDKGGGTVADGDLGGTRNIPRIQVLTHGGDFIRSFGAYGVGDGLLMDPVSICADEAQRLYVADVTEQVVQVFDTSGAHLFTIYDEQQPIRIPVSVYYRNGKAYVVSAYARRLDVFGIGSDYSVLAVQQESMSFEAQPCGETPTGVITLTNGGPGTALWQAVSDSNWLVVTGTGLIEGHSSASVFISFNISSLPSGRHSGTVEITAPGALLIVRIELVVSLPVLTVSPESLSFQADGAELPPPDNLVIELAGDGSGLGWSAKGSEDWISISPPEGSSNTIEMPKVSVDAEVLSGMPGGEYTGQIIVSAGCDAVADEVVTVSLTYANAATIEVTTNVSEAAYEINGPMSYSGSGKFSSFTGVSEGIYTISFLHVDGFVEPEGYSLQAAAGENIMFEGTYKDLRRDNDVIVLPGGVRQHESNELRVFDDTGGLLVSFEVSDELKGGSAAVAAGDMDGDCVEEVLVSHDLGIVTGFTNSGTVVDGLDFRAFPYKSGVDIAVADVDGDGVDEIVTSASSGRPGQLVRVFRYDNGRRSVRTVEIDFLAFEDYNSVKVAAGDVDGDGSAEILTTPGGKGSGEVEVKIWKVASGGSGGLYVYEAGGFTAGTSYGGADITTGDLDANGVDEIIVSVVDAPSAEATRVIVFDKEGEVIIGFTGPSATGVSLAAGDIDFDGHAEVVIGGGDSPGAASLVWIYGSDGLLQREFRVFEDDGTVYGAMVSLGSVGY